MFLIIISLAILFIASYFVYETAQKNGHNAVVWTALAVSAFIATYLTLMIIFGMIINIGIGQSVWTMNRVQYIGELFHLIILALSLGSVMLIMLRVSRNKNKVSLIKQPPPTFNEK